MPTAAITPGTSALLPIEEQSQVGAARRFAKVLARENGLGTDAAGRLAIVVTEAATNILRHAERGTILLRAFSSNDVPTVEMLALDKGPGIANVSRAMNDGFSTSGTPGHGLGGMHRLSHLFEVHSQRGIGTAIVARVSEGVPRPVDTAADAAPPLEDRLGVVCVPFRGETECGDAWRVTANRRQVAVLVVDGLGHGPGAAEASARATTAFAESGRRQPADALAAFDTAMRGTRGAALSFALIDETSRALHFCGVGNVDGRVISADAPAHLMPQNGIVGHTMPNLRSVTTPWPSGARLIMHSDGISARWRLESYAGLATAHPALIAGVLYRDFGRARDDATVLVLADGGDA